MKWLPNIVCDPWQLHDPTAVAAITRACKELAPKVEFPQRSPLTSSGVTEQVDLLANSVKGHGKNKYR